MIAALKSLLMIPERSEEEVKALAEFILFHTPGDKWPSHKQGIFWTSVSKFIEHRVKLSALRTSNCGHIIHVFQLKLVSVKLQVN